MDDVQEVQVSREARMPGATVAADGFAGSESGRTKCARRVWAMDGPQQRTGTAALAIPGFAAPAHPCAMYLQRVLESTLSVCSTWVVRKTECLFSVARCSDAESDGCKGTAALAHPWASRHLHFHVQCIHSDSCTVLLQWVTLK